MLAFYFFVYSSGSNEIIITSQTLPPVLFLCNNIDDGEYTLWRIYAYTHISTHRTWLL